jgi:hypothetical protein
MSFVSSRRPALVAGIVTLSLAGAAAVPASAHTYPSQVNKNFMSSCQKAAVGAGSSKARAKRYRRAALNCISDKLTLRQFKEADDAAREGRKSKYDRTIRNCVNKANRQAG